MAVKRTFDLVVGGIFFVLILPLLVVLALLIKLDSPGPVFFRQERMGRGGRTFDIFKFRSMETGAEQPARRARRPQRVLGTDVQDEE